MVLDAIENHVIKKKVGYMRIDGQVAVERRHERVNKFQNDENCKIAVLAITACATGLTLTKASTVVFAELYFTPAVMTQAEDRAHRIGQEHNCVNVHYLFGKDTVDEKIFNKLSDKFKVVSNTLDAKNLNMDVQNVQKGEMGEIKVGKASKNNLNINQNFSFINNETSQVNFFDKEKSGNKIKITDFFSKKSSNDTNSDLCSSNILIAKKNNLQSKQNTSDESDLVKDINQIVDEKKKKSDNQVNKKEADKNHNNSFDDVLEGLLEEEYFLNQILENENNNRDEFINKTKEKSDNFDIIEASKQFNIHKNGNSKRTRDDMENIQNSLSKKNLKLFGLNKNSEENNIKDKHITNNKQFKRNGFI